MILILSSTAYTLLYYFSIKGFIYEKSKNMPKMPCQAKSKLKQRDPVLYHLQLLDKNRYCKTRFYYDLRIRACIQTSLNLLASLS